MRIVEDEALADEAHVVIERGAVEKLQAARIDEYLRTVGAVEDLVAVLRRRLPFRRTIFLISFPAFSLM